MAGSTRIVWALWGLATAAIVVTYSRVSPDELYHVSHEGIPGGLGRALVFVDFPIALVAPAIAAIAADRLRTKRADALLLVAVALCAVVTWPGVVDQADLDAKLVNVLPAIGVVLVLAVSLAAPDERNRIGVARATGGARALRALDPLDRRGGRRPRRRRGLPLRRASRPRLRPGTPSRRAPR
jgi:hypothetical protein